MIVRLQKNGVLNTDDYRNDEGKFDVVKYLKDSHVKVLESMNERDLVSDSNKKDTVTLYHGTTTAHLNNILKNGLLPRKETNNDNWSEISSSASNVIYLTNKWHYFYAYQATQSHLIEKGRKEGIEPEPWFMTWETVPCYIECEVPKSLLVPDEDFFHSHYISRKIKSALKKERDYIEITWEESLAHYATVGVVGGIPVEYIKSFSILGEVELQKELMFDKSAYQKDMKKWASGKGKGDLKLLDLMKREDSSLLNGAWFMHQIPKNKEIIQIGKNPASNTIAIVFER
jgi:hypothetical protein